MYAFKFDDFVDAAGKVHSWSTSISKKYRVFSEPYATHPVTGNRLVEIRTAPGYVPSAWDRASGSGLGEWPGDVLSANSDSEIGGNMQRTGIWLAEMPGAYMKAPAEKIIPGDSDPDSRFTIRGNVWLETGNERQMLTGGTPLGDPKPGPGYHVWATFLTGEGIQALKRDVNSLPEADRSAATKRLIQQHPEYIKGSIKAPIASNGDYEIQVPRQWRNENVPTMRNFYMWIEDPTGAPIPAYSGFQAPVFTQPDKLNQWQPTTVSGQNPPNIFDPAGFDYHRWYNVNFAIVNRVDNVQLDILNYDLTANPFRIGVNNGEPAELLLKGDIGALPGTIEWRGPRNGSRTVLKKCEGITTVSDLKGCQTFDVPADVKAGDVFTATLKVGAAEIASDSFTVVDERQQSDPKYGPTIVLQGETQTVPAPKSENNTPIPAGTTYAPGNGVPTWATVNPDGTIVVQPPKDLAPGLYQIPVRVTFPATDSTPETTRTIFAPVDVLKDTDGDKLPDPKDPNNVQPGEDKCPNTAGPAYNDGCPVPDWKDASTAPNTPVTVKPTVTGDQKVPGDLSVEVPAGKGTATIAPNGDVIYTPAPDAKVGDQVTVTIKSGDETVDTFVVTITEANQNDPDGDGVIGDADKCPTIPGPASNNGCPDWDDSITTPNKPIELIPNPNPSKLPDGTTVTPIGPGDAKIDPNTGIITVTPKPEAKPGDEIKVEVRVPGQTDPIDTITVTIVEPSDPDGDGVVGDKDKCPNTAGPAFNDGCPVPDWKDVSTVPTAPVTVKPTITGDQKVPGGLKVEVPAGQGTATIQPNGDVVFTPAPNAKAGDKVTVTIKSGDETVDTFVVTIKEPDANDPDNDGVLGDDDKCPTIPGPASNNGCPDWDDSITTPNKPIELIPNPNPSKLPDGTTVTPIGPGDAKIDPNTGIITVTPKPEAKPGDEIKVEVRVPGQTDPIDTITVTIVEPSDPDGDGVVGDKDKCPTLPGPASNNGCPDWKDKPTDPNGNATIKPDTNGKDWPKDSKVTVEVTDGPGTATIDPNTGDITVTPQPEAKDGDEIVVEVKDGDGKTIDTVTVEVIKDSDGDGVRDNQDKCPGTKPGVKVNNDGCPVDGDGDGTPDAKDPSKQTDGDGTDKCPTLPGPASNNGCPDWKDKPTDPNGNATIKPDTNGKDWPKDSKVTVEVTDGPGTATIDPNTGDITVTPQPEAKDGDEIVVEVKDGDGKTIDTVTVEVIKDSDGDGVRDNQDKCPGTIPGAAVNADGCAIDGDGDGVPDPKDSANPAPGTDRCPGTPAGAKVDENGCSVAPTPVVPDKPITGEVDKPITIEIPINNDGKQDIIDAKVEGLPEGLDAKLSDDKTKIIISGTPKKPFDGEAKIIITSRNELGQTVTSTTPLKMKITIKGKGLPKTGVEGAQGAIAVAALLSVAAAGALLRRKQD